MKTKVTQRVYLALDMCRSTYGGAAVLVISQDLDELLAISHRIAVLYSGRLSAPRAADQLSVEEIGLLMAGHGDAGSTKEGRSAA